MSLNHARVLALESRRAVEIAELIRRQQGDPFVAPALRELPAGDDAVLRFAARLAAGDFDLMLALTGVGTRQLSRVIGPSFAESLGRIAVAARGPKPVAALREMGITPVAVAPEPNTWRELLAAIASRPERRIALQEYGRPNPELVAALQARGAEVTTVRVYEYALPEDPAPLREAARRLAAGEFALALFTTAVQIDHLARAARDQGIEDQTLSALRRITVGSIGPTTTEALEEFGIRPTFEPSHPKMGILVREAAQHLNPPANL